MEIHKPKPVHSWREFATEIGIVVIGIAIALGGDQLIRALERRAEVAEAREALRSEIAQNANVALFNIGEERCRGAYLNRVDAWTRGGARPLIRSTAGLSALASSAWDVVKVGAVAHMPLRERLAYSQLYSQVEANRWLIENERIALMQLGGKVAFDELSPAAIQTVREQTVQARAFGLIHAGESVGLLQRAKALGIAPLPLNAAERQGLAELCAEGGIAPTAS
jgi:hypothetical protein